MYNTYGSDIRGVGNKNIHIEYTTCRQETVVHERCETKRERHKRPVKERTKVRGKGRERTAVCTEGEEDPYFDRQTNTHEESSLPKDETLQIFYGSGWFRNRVFLHLSSGKG
jgi:hypothetical protein